MQTKQHHRLIALLMTVVLVFQFTVMTPFAAFAEDTDTGVTSANGEQQISTETEKASGEDSPQLRATGSGKTVLAFTSDIHNGAGGIESNISNNRLSTWLSVVAPKYNNDIHLMGFCGDMAGANTDGTSFWTCANTVMTNVETTHNMTGVYAVGNHEYGNGRMGSSSESTHPEVQAKYSLNQEGHAVSDENYVIYCLGTNSSHGSNWAYDDSQITTLSKYLDSIGNDKVIIILTHFPLHNYGMHNTGNTVPVLNAINEAAVGPDGNYGTSDDKKIVFLWGHNHSEGDSNYDQVWLPGEKINDSAKSTVYFFYAAAGCMADSEYGSSAKVLGKGLVLEIDGDNNNRLSFSYYDVNGNNVTEPSGQTVYEELKEPVAIEGVTITNADRPVKVGKTLQLKYSTTPANATVASATWRSSNENVATVDSNSGKVTGVAEGTATITLTISDGLSRAVVTTQAVVTVSATVPSEEHTVSVTPSTGNPEETVHIEVGDTLIINTTNGSSSSAYDFTASLSKSGVAELQGDSNSANIAAGATVSFTYEGVADGTVDITIQNTNQYGSQYVRKAVIHLTVGEGGDTPVDPPIGDTVSITPSTDNPEESIKINVGDTLTINVTNGSSNSAYDFTATLSKSGVAQISGSSTINISQGGTSQFTVTGLTDGTVDITIQNNSSYGSQYVRKGVIHLTVGEGGDTPVDPPIGDTVSITPSTDNPEESIKINVGDTLTINVTNGSSNSAYDFTATLSKSGVAQIQGNATVNISAGGVGQFTVTGLAEGTVDITIQNENSYGSQYVRKGVVHLTVGEGGTPIDPPVGETVTYQLATVLEDGKEYIIASGNSGSVLLLSNEAGGSRQLKGISATVSADGKLTITSSVAEKTLFTAEANTNSSQSGIWLKNGSQYLYADSSSGLRLVDNSIQSSSDNRAKSWHYKADGKNLLWFFKDTSSQDGYTDTSSTYRYYLDYSSGSYFTDAHVSGNNTLSGTTTPAVYLFVKSDDQPTAGECTVAVTADKTEVLPDDVITFTVTLLGPVSNVGSMSMVLDIPDGLTYIPGSGKLADNLNETLHYEPNEDEIGCFFDEANNVQMISAYGTQNFSTDNDVVLATFKCKVEESFSGTKTVTLKDLEFGDVVNWQLLDANATGVAIKRHEHTWAEPEWNWTGNDTSGYTAATATFTCTSDQTHTQTVDAVIEITTPSSGEDEGYTVYTARVTAANSPDGTAHSDKKRIPIDYGYSISGNITSYIGLNDDREDYVYVEGKVSVVLYASGTEDVVATATVTDDNKTYVLTGVYNGTYDLKVTKQDHAPRTYTVTVSDGAVTQDVEIRLYGDMNGDGRITTFDAARINSHAKGVSSLTGYDLIVADVIGTDGGPDGSVTTIDAARVNSHAKGVSFLW